MRKEWTGCYQDSWKGVITDASFAHPAKFSKALVERILDYMAEKKWINRAGWVEVTPEISESIIADIVAGRYNLAREWIPDSNPEVNQTINEPSELSLSGNIETTGPELGSKLQSRISGALAPSSCGKNTPSSRSRKASSSTISTRTRSTTESKTSPASSVPDTLLATEISSRKRSAGKSCQSETCSVRNAASHTGENISAKTASATTAEQTQGERRSVVTSEGYEVEVDFKLSVFIAPNNYVYRHASVLGDPFGGVGTGGIVAAYRGYQWIGVELEPKFFELARGNYEKHRSKLARIQGAGFTMLRGDSRQFDVIVHAILSSPPFTTDQPCASQTKLRGDIQGPAKRDKQMKTLGSIRMDGESLDAVISSPPYETIHAGAGGLNHLPAKEGQQGGRKKGASQSADQQYGETPGQIAHTKKAPIGAILTSPPYADSINSDSHGIDFSKAKPDYPGRVNHPERNRRHSEGADNMRYLSAPGQIGALKAVVSSPPWEKNVEGGRRKGKFKDASAILKSKRGKGASDAAVLAQAERDEGKTLGDSAGQIGQDKGETYWLAMSKVYHACLLSLKPGGVMALVVKDYVKDKKRMPLCDDTMRVLVWLGFEEIERIHAMLSEEQIHEDLFEGTRSKKKERKSFFRRLHESKLAADDPRRIDYEEVLFVRKPL